MKKVTLAVMVAMVLVTGAMAADDMNSTETGLPTNVFERTGYMTVGAGFANIETAGSPAIMLNYSQADEIAVRNFDFEISKNYLDLSIKANIFPLFNTSYVGIGYLSADGKDKTIAGDGIEIAASTNHSKEHGIYGVAGFQDSFIIDDLKVSGDIGYRFGEVHGPAASIVLSKKFGPNFYSQTLGLKVGFEQIKNSDENINRMVIYGTLTF